MKLKIWVEIMTVQSMTEDIVEVPDAEWAAMSEDERTAYKQNLFEAMLFNLANGGCEEAED